MADGIIWWKAKHPPYKLTMAGIPSQIAYQGWKILRRAMKAI
jgi:hypothetical protein